MLTPGRRRLVIPGICSSTLHLALFAVNQSKQLTDYRAQLSDYRSARGTDWQLDITVAGSGTSCVWKHGSELTYYFPPGSGRKLTTLKMQSESGIVADFEVEDEFHEEPKTYYELKSQPLKNRSVSRAFDSFWNNLMHALQSLVCSEKSVTLFLFSFLPFNYLLY